MNLSRYLITTYVFISSDNYISCNYYNIYYIMKLEDYKKLSEIQLLNELGLQNILEANKAYQNNEIDKDFNNTKLFKPLIESNKELFDRIGKKTDQSDELIKKITDVLPLNQQSQARAEQARAEQARAEQPQVEARQETQAQTEIKEEPQTIIDNENKIISEDFIGDLIKGKKVFLHEGKKDDIYTNIKLRSLSELDNLTKEELYRYLKSDDIKSLTQQLNITNRWHPNVKSIESYINALNEYKKTIKNKILEKSNLGVIKEEDETSEIIGQGIKKRRNGYKIENEKYGNKLKINMDKLYNNYYVEAWYGDNILYENQGDKDTVELLTKGRIDKKKKYSNLSKQIFNDMMILSGMIKKRNGKNKLLGESNIILNENDLKKRIALIRGSIIAGNDNKKLQQELSRLTNQENVTQNKTIDSLFDELKSMTPLLKTSEGDENVHNQVYNIIDYLRTNRHISRDQYHKYIKKHLM